jgi:hypothetical protein
MPAMTLEQLFAPLNTIMQSLAVIDECQVEQSQHQQP